MSGRSKQVLSAAASLQKLPTTVSTCLLLSCTADILEGMHFDIATQHHRPLRIACLCNAETGCSLSFAFISAQLSAEKDTP